MINTNLMTLNDKEPRVGCAPLVDLGTCLTPQPGSNNDSYFAFGHFEADGHTLNYLFHLMQVRLPLGQTVNQAVITVSDETEGWYFSKDYIFTGRHATLRKDHFSYITPVGYMSGDWDAMRIHFDADGIVIDMTTRAIHYPLYSFGTAAFQLCGMHINQFSVPYGQTSGTMTVKGHTYDVTDRGYTWFDRQWQNVRPGNMRWTWMAIYLDDGRVVGAFDTDQEKYRESVATLLSTDGSLHTTHDMTPFELGQSQYWTNPKSHQRYPTHWELDLPGFDSHLSVSPFMKEQDIASKLNFLSKYEGTCAVEGTFQGEPVTGRALVEIIGSWR